MIRRGSSTITIEMSNELLNRMDDFIAGGKFQDITVAIKRSTISFVPLWKIKTEPHSRWSADSGFHLPSLAQGNGLASKGTIR
jgi:hypothetical protein